MLINMNLKIFYFYDYGGSNNFMNNFFVVSCKDVLIDYV